MNKLIAAVVLATAIASPAFAQQQTAPAPDRPVAQEPPATLGQGGRQVPAVPGTGVRDQKGNLLGADPDPRVRQDIKRDPPVDKEDAPARK